MSDYTPAEERKVPGLRLHKRTRMVQQAEAEFEVVLLSFLDSHGHLTDIELASIMLRAPAIPIKYALRMERHGTTEKKADEA